MMAKLIIAEFIIAEFIIAEFIIAEFIIAEFMIAEFMIAEFMTETSKEHVKGVATVKYLGETVATVKYQDDQAISGGFTWCSWGQLPPPPLMMKT